MMKFYKIRRKYKIAFFRIKQLRIAFGLTRSNLNFGALKLSLKDFLNTSALHILTNLKIYFTTFKFLC